MSAAPDERHQLEFLQHIQRIFEEGEFVATYKFALLVALVELSIEGGDDTGACLELPLLAIADKFIQQYWQHAAPYSAQSRLAVVLVQNNGRQAEILSQIAQMRERFVTLARARNDASWPRFVGRIARIVEKMPLWKLQTLRRQKLLFLYERSKTEGHITLLPGVAFNLRRFGALIQLLARNAWIHHIRSNAQNAGAVGSAGDLEAFLFGGTRGALSAARDVLQEVQDNRCFYCDSPMRSEPHVDHFIPWSRYQRDLAHNFVLAHNACNMDKGDLLAGPAHVGQWVKRNDELERAIGDPLGRAGFVDDLETTLQVARWAYTQAEARSAQLWVRMKYTINADGSCLKLLNGGHD